MTKKSEASFITLTHVTEIFPLPGIIVQIKKNVFSECLSHDWKLKFTIFKINSSYSLRCLSV